jgi:hypothetical protein
MPTHAPTPDLSLPLAHPITLTGGPGSHLVTLMDAAILIRDLEPFRQARPVWDSAAEMILTAARWGAGRHRGSDAATACLSRARELVETGLNCLENIVRAMLAPIRGSGKMRKHGLIAAVLLASAVVPAFAHHPGIGGAGASDDMRFSF